MSTETPPARKRLKTSRPRSSVPNHVSLDGGANGNWPSTPWSGSYGATNGPMKAIPTMRSVIPTPIFVRCCDHAVARRRRHGRRPSLAVELDLDRVGDGDAAHESDVLRRGLTRIVARSASRLRITYSAAMSSATACTTGMSRARTESTSRSPTPW